MLEFMEFHVLGMMVGFALGIATIVIGTRVAGS
jgi:hypothetical protein